MSDWQSPEPGAYDPDHPIALLEMAGEVTGQARAMRAVWAVRSMLAAGANTGALSVAKSYAKAHKLISAGDFDSLVREHRAESGPADTGKPSASTLLVELAQSKFTFGLGDQGETFAVPVTGPKVVSMLRGGRTSLRALLAREFYAVTSKAASQSALSDALTIIEGLAQETEETRLYLRAAQYQGSLWLDLGDQTGRAVRVTSRGWTVEDVPPVLFKRTSLTGALPEPKRGGSIDDLWSWLNVTEADRPLVAAELVARLFTEQPHVVLALLGEQGTGKSTALRILVSLTDPSPVPLRQAPRDPDSWITAASGSWVVGLDNLSVIPPWLSDSLCRASTGDGDIRRRLYSDADFAVFAFRRCVAFNGIDVGALAPDLADRTVSVTLERIPEESRADEETFWGGWPGAHPELLGAVLDLASRVLARLPGIKLDRKPRMADFARILAAVDAELGTTAFDRYTQASANMAADAVDSDPFAHAIREAYEGGHAFFGSSAELLEEVTPKVDGWRAPKGWPADARAVTGKMKRLAPAFRKTGWAVEQVERGGHDKQLRWQISSPRDEEKPGEGCPPCPHARTDGEDCPECLNPDLSFAGNAGKSGHGSLLSPQEEKEKTPAMRACEVCGGPMSPALLPATMHPLCDPAVAP